MLKIEIMEMVPILVMRRCGEEVAEIGTRLLMERRLTISRKGCWKDHLCWWLKSPQRKRVVLLERATAI